MTGFFWPTVSKFVLLKSFFSCNQGGYDDKMDFVYNSDIFLSNRRRI